MTPEQFIDKVRERIADTVAGTITVSKSGGVSDSVSFVVETDAAQYRVSIESHGSERDKGWVGGSVLEKDGNSNEIGYLGYGELDDKSTLDNLVKRIEEYERRFTEQLEFRAGWDSAESAQEARINAAMDTAKVI